MVSIAIWGDLRDYDNADTIKKRFEHTLSQFTIVRDAVLRIQVEGQKPLLLAYPVEEGQ